MRAMKIFMIVLLVLVVLIGGVFAVGSLMGGNKDLGEAPDFTAVTLAGEDFTLSRRYQTAGAALVFFDRNQVKSAALLQNLDGLTKSKDVRFILVAETETDAAALTVYLKENQVTPDDIILDTDQKIAKLYNVTTCPVTYFINAKGSVRAVTLANLSPGNVEKYLGYLQEER